MAFMEGAKNITLPGKNVMSVWLVVATLYAACWFLPIMDDYIGYDGAEFAHKELWKLLSGEAELDTPASIFGAFFIAIGWLANELFVLGVVALWKWPHAAVRLLAFSLGIMVSWQVAFAGEFPLRAGYWFWVMAGAMALWLSAARVGAASQTSVRAVLGDRVVVALLLVPIVNAAIAAALGGL